MSWSETWHGLRAWRPSGRLAPASWLPRRPPPAPEPPPVEPPPAPRRRLAALLDRDLRTPMAYVAYAVVLISAVTAYLYDGPYTNAPGMGAALLVACLLGFVVREWRVWIHALAGAAACYGSGDAIRLWMAGAALIYLSAVEDRRRVPLPALASGLVAALASTVAYRFSTPAPFIAVMVGLGVAWLIRSRDQLATETVRLRASTAELRDQALWLEQRTALARELHDVVGHHVTAMVVQAEAGQVGDPAAALRTIADTGRTALGDLDQLVVHLRDPAAALQVTAPPRLADIDELLAEPLRQQGVEVHVRLDPEPGLDEIGVLTAYRIAQEALTNVTRHARASAAWVELVRVGDRVRLRVSDDGIGPPAAPGRGAGLIGIEERVLAHGGSWELSERPGGGTMLEANLPVTVP